MPGRAAAFLAEFHEHFPGATRRAFARGRSEDGRSSYELLADQVPAHARTLDVGCGDGWLLVLLGARGVEAIGLDPSAAELAANAGHGAAVVRARAESMPFADAAFDACVSHLALSVLDEPAPAIAEIARVLAPGGRLAIVTGGGPANDDALAWFLDLLAPELARSAMKPPRLGDKRTRHAAGLDELLAPRGFAPVAWRSHVIDLGGSWDDVWVTLSTLYELAYLDPAPMRDALRARVPAGRVPCTMRIGLATTGLVRK